MYKAIIAIGIAAAACLVAGCGGSSDETAEAAVTKAQFIKQAEAICEKAQEGGRDALAAWEKDHGDQVDAEATFRNIVGPTLKQEAEELRSLTMPDEDQAKLARMIDNLLKAADVFVAEGFEPKSTSNLSAFAREAEAYGLRACRI